MFVVHSDIWEVSKSVLEALLAGLPVIINRRKGEPVPEWRDTILIPGATGSMNINEADFGTVTFRTFYDPAVPGSFVFHCHILTHEDVGMMQKLTVFP